MVQSSDSWNRDNLTHLSRFDRPFFGSVLLKSEVRSIFVVVDNEPCRRNGREKWFGLVR